MFFKIRVRASSSLITTDLINWHLEIGNSDENREHATKSVSASANCRLEKPDSRRYSQPRLFGEVAEGLKAALC
jgi:hypothetical protein